MSAHNDSSCMIRRLLFGNEWMKKVIQSTHSSLNKPRKMFLYLFSNPNMTYAIFKQQMIQLTPHILTASNKVLRQVTMPLLWYHSFLGNLNDGWVENADAYSCHVYQAIVFYSHLGYNCITVDFRGDKACVRLEGNCSFNTLPPIPPSLHALNQQTRNLLLPFYSPTSPSPPILAPLSPK